MNKHYTPTEEELTAYVLGECDTKQTEAIEEAVAFQKDTAELLGAIRETIKISEGLFSTTTDESLSEEQRAEVASAAENVVPIRKHRIVRTALSTAAALLLLGVMSAVFMPALSRDRGMGVDYAQNVQIDKASKSEPKMYADLNTQQLEQLKALGYIGGDEEENFYPEDVVASGSTANDQTPNYWYKEKNSAPETKPEPKGVPLLGDLYALKADPRNIPARTSRTPDGTSGGGGRGGGGGGSRGGVANSVTVQISDSDSMAITPEQLVALESLGYLDSSSQSTEHEVNYMFYGYPARPATQPEPITPGSEGYDHIIENKFKKVAQAPLSTFSIDVDTASYSNMRRFLNSGQMPPVDSVRVEELINYFNYDYPQPRGEDPFSSNIEVASAPWNPQHKLVRIGLKGLDIVAEERPASNLVFLLDVSGSMSSHNKLPLVKDSIRMLTQQLTDHDRVTIVVYAGNSGLVLPPTSGSNHQAIIGALDRLNAGGSTNGGAGIELAYKMAKENFIEGGVNRVILATDGDFNVGNTSRNGLVNQIESSAKSGVFLTVLGFGMGNLKDATMENLADKGNGNYAYIDTFHEAKKVLVDQMNGTLFTIAKDVKIQVEFNPNRVESYRLIGYENRKLANRDFNDDTKDAGEIGAGHTVTALYEIVPTGVSGKMPQEGVDSLRYKEVEEEVSKPQRITELNRELLTVKLRYKQPDGNESKLLKFYVRDANTDYRAASKDFKFATAVAVFGMKLRHSPFAQHMSYNDVLQLAEGGLGHDLNGYRAEFLGLVRKAQSMNPRPVYQGDPRR